MFFELVGQCYCEQVYYEQCCIEVVEYLKGGYCGLVFDCYDEYFGVCEVDVWFDVFGEGVFDCVYCCFLEVFVG